MRIVFMGTPAFAVPSLAALVAGGHEIAAVYSQPPRPSGRGHKVTPSPVHGFAETHGIEVRTPLSLKSDEEKQAFAALDADIAVVVAYGLILPKAVLEAPELGCVNLHGSLLPRWRGAAPIQRAIMAGDAQTGVQVMQMERGLDTGPVLMSESMAIAPDDTAGTLSEKLAHIGADLLTRALPALARGGIEPQIQSEDGVTYAAKIDSAEAQVDWRRSAAEIDAHIRGLNPFPGAWSVVTSGDTETRLKLHLATPLEGHGDAAPGEIIATGPAGVDVQTGKGVLRLLRLQRPGKAQQDAETFLRGCALSTGDRFA